MPTDHKAVKAVILDFDGVTVDSLAAHFMAWDIAVREVFHRPLDDHLGLAGLSTRAIAGVLAKRYGDPSLARTLATIKEDKLTSGAVAVGWLGGAQQFIMTARRHGLPLGIASNSRSKFIHAILQQLGHPRESWGAIVGADEVAQPKPKPDVFLECARRLKVHPDDRRQVLVFDDSPHGLVAAVAAGMRAIGVASSCERAALLEAGAEDTVPELGQALYLL